MNIVETAEPRNHNPQRSRAQSKVRQQKGLNTGTWLPIEDTRLREAVRQHGTRWVRVADVVGTRNGDQCAKRWTENLNPNLDHSPWTTDEDEHLTSFVQLYGRNWKFMADNVFESRAPLALKNRYSLLMRRLDRQENRQQEVTNSGIIKPSRHSVYTHPLSTRRTPLSPNCAVDLTNFLNSGSDTHNRQSEYTNTSASFPLTTGLVNSVVTPTGDVATSSGGLGGDISTAPWAPTTARLPWDDQRTWLQPPPLYNGIGYNRTSSGTSTSGVDNEVETMIMTPENSTSSQCLPTSGDGPKLRSPESSDSSTIGIGAQAEVEYSVTCQWGKLKTLMNHLVEAAMSESAKWTAEDDLVTISLRLKV